MTLHTTESYDDLSSDFGWTSHGCALIVFPVLLIALSNPPMGTAAVTASPSMGNDCDRRYDIGGIVIYAAGNRFTNES